VPLELAQHVVEAVRQVPDVVDRAEAGPLEGTFEVQAVLERRLDLLDRLTGERAGTGEQQVGVGVRPVEGEQAGLPGLLEHDAGPHAPLLGARQQDPVLREPQGDAPGDRIHGDEA